MGIYFKKKIIDKLGVLVKVLQDFYGKNMESMVVFGSLAGEEFASYSDIDLLLILSESNFSIKERIRQFYKELATEFEGHFLSPIILTKEEIQKFNTLYLGIIENYIILYDKKGTARDFLSKIEDKIKKGEIVKKDGYWKIIDEAIKVS